MNKKIGLKEKDYVLWLLWGAVVAVLVATMLFPLLRIFAELKAESFGTVFNSRKFLSVYGQQCPFCILGFIDFRCSWLCLCLCGSRCSHSRCKIFFNGSCPSSMQVRTTLDDAALSLGSTRTGICGTIIAPLCSEGILCSFVYTLSRGIGTVSAVIFLVSFDTPLASLKILNLAEQGNWGQATSLALVLTKCQLFWKYNGKKRMVYPGRK